MRGRKVKEGEGRVTRSGTWFWSVTTHCVYTYPALLTYLCPTHHSHPLLHFSLALLLHLSLSLPSLTLLPAFLTSLYIPLLSSLLSSSSSPLLCLPSFSSIVHTHSFVPIKQLTSLSLTHSFILSNSSSPPFLSSL